MTVAPPRPPSHDELEALIREARARQRHRRLRAAATLAALAAAALAGWVVDGAVSGSSTARSPLVPIVDPRAFAGHGNLAFVSRDRLWLLDGRTGRLVRVAGPGARSPAFSPEGRWLTWYQGPKRFGIARSDGSGSRLLASHGRLVRWLPDGRLLVGRAIYEIDGRGIPVRVGLAPAGLVSWTPDGSRYAFVEERAISHRHDRSPLDEIQEVEVASSLRGPRTLWYTAPNWFRTRDGWRGAGIQNVALLPKGGILLWLDPMHSASIASDGLPVYAIRSPRAHPQKLGVTLGKPLSLGADGRFALGAGGDRIAWTSKQVVTCTVAGCEPLHAHGRMTLDPAWSPDGRALAYVTGADLGVDVTTLPLTMRRWYATRQLRIGARTVPNSAGAASPVWSADGRSLLFVSRDGLWLVPRLGSPPVRIASPLFWPGHWPNYYGQVDWADQFAWASPSTGRDAAAVKSGKACGVRVDGVRVVDSAGRPLYREPGDWTPAYPKPHEVRCSGSTVWVVWDNGAAAMQEAYVGARSSDGGRTWKLAFAEGYFGVNAPHELDAYLGAWTLRGPRVAYFTGSCPACGKGTVSLWVTKDGGRTFDRYRIPALTGYTPVGIRASGRDVTIVGKRVGRGARLHKTVRLYVA